MRKFTEQGTDQENEGQEVNPGLDSSTPGDSSPDSPQHIKKWRRTQALSDLSLFMPAVPPVQRTLFSAEVSTPNEVVAAETTQMPVGATAATSAYENANDVANPSTPVSPQQRSSTVTQRRFYSPENYEQLRVKYQRDLFLPTPHDYPGNTRATLSFLDGDCEPRSEQLIAQRVHVVKRWNLAVLRLQAKRSAKATADTQITNRAVNPMPVQTAEVSQAEPTSLSAKS